MSGPFQFAVPGLSSGASQWVAFFGPDAVRLCEVSAFGVGVPAEVALLPVVMTPSWEATPELEVALARWAEELRPKAKRVLEPTVKRVELRLRMLRHQLIVTPLEGPPVSMWFLERERATGQLGLVLRRWFNERFVLSRTSVYGVLEQVAPFLTK